MYLNTNTFGCISNTNTFQMKRTNSLFFLCFLFWWTQYITSQHQLDLSHQFMNFLLITPKDVHNSHQSDEERWHLIGFTHKMFHIILWSLLIMLNRIEDNLPLIDKEAIRSHYIKYIINCNSLWSQRCVCAIQWSDYSLKQIMLVTKYSDQNML